MQRLRCSSPSHYLSYWSWINLRSGDVILSRWCQGTNLLGSKDPLAPVGVFLHFSQILQSASVWLSGHRKWWLVCGIRVGTLEQSMFYFGVWWYNPLMSFASFRSKFLLNYLFMEFFDFLRERSHGLRSRQGRIVKFRRQLFSARILWSDNHFT